MSRADYVIKRVDAALKTIGGLTRQAYKRVTTSTGGDALIGRQGSVSVTETLFDPQPYYRQLGHHDVMLLNSSGGQFVADDYKFTFSVNSLTQSDINAGNLTISLKDASGNVEVLRIIYFNNESFGQEDVALTVIARSISR